MGAAGAGGGGGGAAAATGGAEGAVRSGSRRRKTYREREISQMMRWIVQPVVKGGSMYRLKGQHTNLFVEELTNERCDEHTTRNNNSLNTIKI